MSDAEQVAAVRAYLDAGAPVGQEQGIFGLAMAHSELILPVLEKKVEEVLRAQDPMDCFTNKNTRPDSVIALAVSMITHSDGEPAMKELAKLVALDEKRFGREVFSGLAGASSHQNGFSLAYKSFDPANPALDRAITAWAETFLDRPTPTVLELRDWADALVERYGGVPVGPEWDNDPIVSGLKPALAESLHPEMLRLASEAWEKHPRRMLAMSDKDQIALVQSALDRGIPYEQREAMRALAITHSSLILPLIEARVEAVLKSPEQIEPNVDMSLRPDRYIVSAMGIIAYAGDEEALKQLAKLMKTAGFAKLRLQGLVSSTLGWAGERGNPFALAYRGLEMGDPDVDKPIIAWAEQRLAEPSLNQTKDPRRQVAKAMVSRYGALPTPEQWAKDPLVSRLKPSLAESLHTDIVRFAAEAQEKRAQE